MKKIILFISILMLFQHANSQPNPEDILSNIDRFHFDGYLQGTENFKNKFGQLFNGLDFVVSNKNFTSDNNDPSHIIYKPDCQWFKIHTITLNFSQSIFATSCAPKGIDFFENFEVFDENNVQAGSSDFMRNFIQFCISNNIPYKNILNFNFDYEIDQDFFSLKTKSVTITYYECIDLTSN